MQSVDDPPRREPLLSTSRALVQGAEPSLLLVAACACAQRVALPLAALWLSDGGPKSALLLLLSVSALSFVRARAADHVSRIVRLRVVEKLTSDLQRAELVDASPAEVRSARLATALPTLVGFSVDGVATLLAGVVAIPVVTWLLASTLGRAALVPIVVAGLVGALITMLVGPRQEATWSRTFEHARNVLASATAAFSGAAELIVHGRAQAIVESLRAEVTRWSRAELAARTTSALASWGALSATLVTAALVSAVLMPSATTNADGDRLNQGLLLVLATIPTAQMTLAGISTLLHGRSELAALGAEVRPAEAKRAQAPEKLDPAAEIRFEKARFRYPKSDANAIAELSFTLPERESLAIVGPNGSGKTTLLWLLLGLVRPTEGDLKIGAISLRHTHASFDEHVAFVSQNPYEPPNATIADVLSAFEERVDAERLCKALEEVGLRRALCARAGSDDAMLKLPVAALSRGQARRVMLARALVRDAKLLVLDEPEAHLDAASVAELATLLQKLAQTRRVIAAVHDPAVLGFAQKVLRLS